MNRRLRQCLTHFMTCSGMVFLILGAWSAGLRHSEYRAIKPAKGYVHRHGTQFMAGTTLFQPRGVNLGNWLVPEPYMMGGGRSNEHLRQALQTSAGSPAHFDAWQAAWRDNYITQADIRRIRSLGFNTVRVPLDWRDFVDAQGHAVDAGVYHPAAVLPPGSPIGLRYLDRLLDWCTAAGIYVLPDMHVYPDTTGQGSVFVDSETDSNTFLDQVKAAWATIGGRYRDATNILGYDLLNEPAGYHDDLLRPTYVQIRNAIRTVDTRHMIVVEPNVFSDLGTPGHWFLGAPIDANMAIAPHFYGGAVPASIDADLPTAANDYNGRKYLNWQYASENDIPLLIGETGENSDDWLRRMVRLWTNGKDGLTAGVLFWTYKKPGDARHAIVTVPWTPGWVSVAHYLQNGGPVPPKAFPAMMDMAKATNAKNEISHPDIVSALMPAGTVARRESF